MYFKFFTLSSHTEKDILKADFQVNSYEKHNDYNGLDTEFNIRTPKDYLFRGDIWKEIDSSFLNEKSYCLAKTPFLTSQELWDLFVLSEINDDRIGALVLMYKNYYPFLVQKQKALIEENNSAKKQKRAIKELSQIM